MEGLQRVLLPRKVRGPGDACSSVRILDNPGETGCQVEPAREYALAPPSATVDFPAETIRLVMPGGGPTAKTASYTLDQRISSFPLTEE